MATLLEPAGQGQRKREAPLPNKVVETYNNQPSALKTAAVLSGIRHSRNDRVNWWGATLTRELEVLASKVQESPFCLFSEPKVLKLLGRGTVEASCYEEETSVVSPGILYSIMLGAFLRFVLCSI